jgi:hypothetical protein
MEIFKEFLRKYPESDFADEAKFFIEDIESGGKNFENLQKKIDSISAADSAKAAKSTAKSTAKSK